MLSVEQEPSKPPTSRFDRWAHVFQIALLTFVALLGASQDGLQQVVSYVVLVGLVIWGAWAFNKAARLP